MCFMFGASKEHVHLVLGLVDEAEHDEEVIEEELVSVAQDWGSSSCPAVDCRA